MQIKRKIVADAVWLLIRDLSLDELTAIYKAQQNVEHAINHLGMNTQIAATNTAQTVAREIIEGLYDYQIDQMGHQLKLAARDLTKYTAEVAA